MMCSARSFHLHTGSKGDVGPQGPRGPQGPKGDRAGKTQTQVACCRFRCIRR